MHSYSLHINTKKNYLSINMNLTVLGKNGIDDIALFQLKEESSVHGSDEEADVSPEVDSDEDLSDGGKNIHEEVSRMRS